MKRLLTFIIVAALALSLAGCGGEPVEEDTGVSVVATVFAPYDFARELVGDNGTVSMLLPPGSEAHSYEPTPKDIIEIQNCDVLSMSAACPTPGWRTYLRAWERASGP